jgi:hypothetical protein
MITKQMILRSMTDSEKKSYMKSYENGDYKKTLDLFNKAKIKFILGRYPTLREKEEFADNIQEYKFRVLKNSSKLTEKEKDQIDRLNSGGWMEGEFPYTDEDKRFWSGSTDSRFNHVKLFINDPEKMRKLLRKRKSIKLKFKRCKCKKK